MEREEEITVLKFDKLPERAKELYFEYMSPNFDLRCGDIDKSSLVHTVGLNYEKCKSPIEIIFNVAYDIMRYEGSIKHFCAALEPQRKIVTKHNNYIADFYLDTEETVSKYFTLENNLKLIVECDGHDFHEKTKEQVERGNRRDYDLKMCGIEVLHYSGSEIFDHPFVCAVKTILFIEEKIGKWEMLNGRS